jgi:hypothetical protein
MAMCVLGAVSDVWAQPAVQMRAVGQSSAGGQRYVSSWSSSMYWLTRDDVKKELELVDEQVAAIEQIRKDLQQERMELYKGMQGLSQQERQKRYREASEKSRELTRAADTRIKETLLPEQLDRLQQITLQMRLRNYVGYALAGDDLVKALNISDDQKQKLRDVQQQAQREMQEKYREFYQKLREETQERVLDVLTKRQRDKLEEMQGEKFEWQTTQRKTQ